MRCLEFARAARRVGCWLALLAASPLVARAGEVTQWFPADQPAMNMDTQWRVVWGIENHGGGSEVLYIKEAFFKRSKADAEIRVLGDCRLADIFVPYNSGTRIYDISGYNFTLVDLDKDAALGPKCVKPGVIYARNGEAGPAGPVAAEVHDGQIRWMNAQEKIRRGQSLTLWAVLDGANYRYVMLYEFRDDGQVGFRLGATAHNLSASDADSTTHLHMGFWRLHVELGDARQTKVSAVRFDTRAARTVTEAIGKESRIEWKPEDYTRLRVESLVHMNTHNPAHPISYELVPVRTGSGRFHGVGEEFTHHDLWVTRPRAIEVRPRDLNAYENAETLTEGPMVLWHQASVLHVARDEDFGVNGTNNYDGVAITAWAGCDLKPRNFFPSTPLYR